jgi:hypothetical protein
MSGKMKKIGLLSDTHAWWDDRYLKYFAPCDEIWLAGDVVDESICDRLEATGKTCRIVWGNADPHSMRLRYPKDQRFRLEGVSVWMTHIGGYPGHWPRDVYRSLLADPPRLFVCGHSHICKAVFDHSLGVLVLNPGAAGTYGQQVQRTLMRFELDAGQVQNLEVIELADNR